jgi:hypothetical protein
MTYTVARTTGDITLGGTTTGAVIVASPMQTTATLTVDDINVGETLKMFLFFIQSRHPEVFK